MQTEITTEQQLALDQNDGIVESGDVILMRTDVFREMLGFASDDDVRRMLQIGFDQADRGQLVDWDPDKLKAEGRLRQQQSRNS